MKIGLKLSLVNAVVVVIIMAISITFLTTKDIKQRNDEVLKNCRLIVEELKITREYLAESLAAFGDVILDEKLANFIPARAGYGIAKKFTKETGYILKQTSLKLRNPDNAPDEFERRVLKMFEDKKELKEYWEIDKGNEKNFFRYMLPLAAKESCLRCHGDKEKIPVIIKEKYKEDTATDYKLGDIRGAVSLKIPYNIVSKAIWGGFWHLIIIALVTTGACVGVVFFLSKMFVSSPLQGLIKVSMDVREGKLDQDVKVQRRYDEIGTLINAFDEMVKSMRLLTGQATVVSQGDLTINVESGGELAHAFNTMVENLRTLIRQTQESIVRISSVSVEMLSTSEEQASGSAELAASISEITATVEELSSSAKQIAANVETVAKVAEDSETMGHQGMESVSAASHIMEEIREVTKNTAGKILSLSEKAQKVGDVLGLIKEIAGETHLLALNASIEASAAGEFGKRFGVVASEVRRLAERTKTSTEEIKGIVSEIQTSTNAAVLSTEQSVKNVGEGVNVVQKVGHSLESIVNLIQQTAEASRQIVMATHQQKSATEQVVGTMQEISEVVKQTAAGLKQSTVAVAELNKLADDFKEGVKKFKT